MKFLEPFDKIFLVFYDIWDVYVLNAQLCEVLLINTPCKEEVFKLSVAL